MAEFVRSVRINPKLEIDRSVFPFTLPVFHGFERLALHPDVTFFVGENGSGKSTFLEAIAVANGHSAEGGAKYHQFSTYDSHSDLHDVLQLERGAFPEDTLFLRAETFYNFATHLAKVGGKRYGQLHNRSHGESFLDTFKVLRGKGLFMLDEPESALSLTGLLSLMGHMKRLINLGSQFIIATHSPILLGLGHGKIYEFTGTGIEATNYRDTKQYQLTLDFLQNPNRYAEFLYSNSPRMDD